MFDSSMSLLQFIRHNQSSSHLKIDDLKIIISNLFFLLNKLRKKQSLLYLEQKMKHQIKQKRELANKILSQMKNDLIN